MGHCRRLHNCRRLQVLFLSSLVCINEKITLVGNILGQYTQSMGHIGLRFLAKVSVEKPPLNLVQALMILRVERDGCTT